MAHRSREAKGAVLLGMELRIPSLLSDWHSLEGHISTGQVIVCHSFQLACHSFLVYSFSVPLLLGKQICLNKLCMRLTPKISALPFSVFTWGNLQATPDAAGTGTPQPHDPQPQWQCGAHALCVHVSQSPLTGTHHFKQNVDFGVCMKYKEQGVVCWLTCTTA